MSYTYFLASLPSLMKRGGAPLSSAEYLDRLADQLSADEASAMLADGLFRGHRSPLEAVVSRHGMASQAVYDGDGNGRGHGGGNGHGDGDGHGHGDGDGHGHGSDDGLAAHERGGRGHEGGDLMARTSYEGGGHGLAAQMPYEGSGLTAQATTEQAAYEGDGAVAVPILAEWRVFDSGLRGEIGRMRAKALKIAADPHWPQMDSGIYIEELRRIFQQSDALQRELQIHDLRWDFLVDGAQRWSGTLGEAIVYYIKLRMLERLQTMTREQASRVLDGIYTQCHAQFREKIDELISEKSMAEEQEYSSAPTEA